MVASEGGGGVVRQGHSGIALAAGGAEGREARRARGGGERFGWVALLPPRWMFPCCLVHDLEERRSWQRRVSAARSGDPRRQRPCLFLLAPLWH